MKHIRYFLLSVILDLGFLIEKLAAKISDSHRYEDRYGSLKDLDERGLVQVCIYKIGDKEIALVISTWRFDYWAEKLGYKKTDE